MTRTAPFFRFETAPRDFRSRVYALALGLALVMPIFGYVHRPMTAKVGAESGYRVSDNYKTDAYGVELATSGVTSNSYRFAGEQFDVDLHSLYLRARNYSLEKGNFEARDTFDGEDIESPSSKYSYGSRNPVNRIDPSGYFDLGVSGYNATTNVQGVMSATVSRKFSFANGVEDRFEVGDLSLSHRGEEFIKSFEAFVPYLYNDSAKRKNCTIGYGHLVHMDSCTCTDPREVDFLNGISKEDATTLFDKGVESEAIKPVKRAVKTLISQNEFDALVSITFNFGSTNLLSSRILIELNKGHYAAAGQEIPRYAAGGSGIPRRRSLEQLIFYKSVYINNSGTVKVPRACPSCGPGE